MYGELKHAALSFEDVLALRIKLQNRYRAYDTGALDATLLADPLAELEATARRVLLAEYRRSVPKYLRDWEARIPGIGEHTMALLLGAIGDPAEAHPLDAEGEYTAEPYWRDVEDLLAYCGHGAPMRRKQGMKADAAKAAGNARAKKAVWMMAAGVIKAGNPQYRAVYDHRREQTADRVHPEACRWCHAKAGGPWQPRHQYADALRIVGKAILTDLHRVAIAAADEKAA